MYFSVKEIKKGERVTLDMPGHPMNGKTAIVVHAPMFHNWQDPMSYEVTLNFGSAPYNTIAYKYLKKETT